MKLFLATFLASSLALAKAEDTSAELLDRWKLSEPTVTFNATSNIFTFVYDPLHNDNTLSTMAFSFYDDRCKDDGSADFDSNPEYDLEAASLLAGISGFPQYVNGYPQYEYQGDIPDFVNDDKIYTEITADTNYADYPGVTEADIGNGVARFCVRFDIGYLIGTDLKDVNFRESIVQLKFNLTVGFEVAEFDVAPKERVTTTTVKDNYALVGYLCTPGTDDTVDDRTVPALKTQGEGEAFNQGDLVSVCVRPDGASVGDGIIIDSITSYDWERGDITQPAVVDSENAGNGLSLYECATSGYYCTIESILFAEFYATSGTVSGTGAAQLAFEDTVASRRLNDAEAKAVRRKLEQEDASADFDVSVGVNAGADGPGAIRTAGGPSMGVTVLATLGALVSAALLA